MSERLSARVAKGTVTATKKGPRLALEFTALVTDTSPADGGVGNPGLPEEIRELFLNTAKVAGFTRAALGEIEARPFGIYERKESTEAELQEESVTLEAIRLRRDEKAQQEGRGIITWADFRVTLACSGTDWKPLLGLVGKWVWLTLKS